MAGPRRVAREPGTRLPFAWAVVWVGGAVFEAMPHHGNAALAFCEYLAGVGALAPRTRVPAAALGMTLSLALWVLSQDLGSLTTGQATDPNTGPLLAVMAIALLGDRWLQPVERPHALTSPA